MKIYTKTGDHGQTSLASGHRVEKTCQRLEAYGTIDELNSHVGLLQSLCADRADRHFLTRVQRLLFIVGGNLATQCAPGDEMPPALCVSPDDVSAVEQEIDRLQSALPPLRAFVLPGGCQAAAQAHVCRTVCRRAERETLRLSSPSSPVDEQVKTLVNRLSDYFFVLSRHLNLEAGVGDTAL